MIIATDPNTEGEATATYLVRMLRDFPGLSGQPAAVGPADGRRPRFADELTLGRALSGRRRCDVGSGHCSPVKRTAEQSRSLIVDAAGRAFATRPYREITLKDIAEDAGVSAPLIIEYFGSKEQLFDALVDFRAGAEIVFSGPLDGLGERMVSMFARPLEPYKPLSLNILFMSGPSRGEQSQASRQLFGADDRRAGRTMPGPDARLRAELVMSMLTGLAVMRRKMMQEHATGTPEEVVAHYAPLVQELLDG